MSAPYRRIGDDIVGPYAIQLLSLAYMCKLCDRADEAHLQEIREAIELAKGWRLP